MASLLCTIFILSLEPYTMLVCRITRELVVNALKHSHATRIDVKLQQKYDIIALQVSDNGNGFSPASDDHFLHHGLASIQEQISFLNGRITIKPNTEGGTKIRILIPMKGEESYASFVSR